MCCQVVRGHVADMLGDGPTQLRIQAQHEFLRPATDLDPSVAARDPVTSANIGRHCAGFTLGPAATRRS